MNWILNITSSTPVDRDPVLTTHLHIPPGIKNRTVSGVPCLMGTAISPIKRGRSPLTVLSRYLSVVSHLQGCNMVLGHFFRDFFGLTTVMCPQT